MWVELLAIKKGGEYVVEIRCRGWRYQFPGSAQLEEMLRVINGMVPMDELMQGYRASGVQGSEDGSPAGRQPPS
jgi:hypothetical protein